MTLSRIFAGLSNEVLIAAGGTAMLLLTILVIYITCWEEPHSQPYRFRHDSPSPVPGARSTFTSTDTLVSTRTNTILRTYHTPPQPRAGNGLAHPTRPRAVLVWSASVGQHSTRYAHVAQHIAPLGYAMCALDHSGTGESAGPRGCMSRFEDDVADLIQYGEHVQNMYPGIPMFVGGQACGACLAICAALDAPQLFRGMILLAPALHSNLHPYLRSLVPFLSHIVPSLPIAKLAPVDQYSRNPNVATSLSRDPLLPKGRLTASTGAEIVRLMSHVNAQLPHISIPYLVQHGLRDMICCPTGTRRLVTETTRVRPHHKTLVALPRCWHDLLHEPEYDEVIGHIVDWLDEQIRVAELVKTLD